MQQHSESVWVAEEVSVLEADMPSAGPAPRCGMVLSPSHPGQLHRGRRLMAEQQHFVLVQKNSHGKK